MKTIGLIGGMSWESTLEYYRILNETVKARLGGLHSAQCLLYSVDFAEVELLQHEGLWEEAGQLMAEAALRLEHGGADFIVLATNTMHKCAPQIEAAVSIPLMHIVDATAQAVQAAGITCVGLLGTRFTMEEEFYKGRLAEQHGLQVVIPEESDREVVHQVIYNELCLGVVKEDSRLRFTAIIDKLVSAGAQGVILGCTEIELLVHPEDCPVPAFPTTRLHAEAAVDYALKPE